MNYEEFNKRIPKSIKILVTLRLLFPKALQEYTDLGIDVYQDESDGKGAAPRKEK